MRRRTAPPISATTSYLHLGAQRQRLFAAGGRPACRSASASRICWARSTVRSSRSPRGGRGHRGKGPTSSTQTASSSVQAQHPLANTAQTAAVRPNERARAGHDLPRPNRAGQPPLGMAMFRPTVAGRLVVRTARTGLAGTASEYAFRTAFGYAFRGGRYWDRTSDLFGVNEALSR